MYFWTCWYTKRYRLTIYLTLAVALTILGALPDGFEYHYGHWVLAKMTLQRVAEVWDVGAGNTLVLILVLLLFAAADLGALAMGDVAKGKDLDFLLTRPRPRRYFIRTSWLAGVAELIPLLVIPILASILVMFCKTHALLARPLLRLAIPLFALAVAMYALVFLLATVSGGAQNGFQIAALVVFLYAGLNYARNEAWFDPDYHHKFFGAFDWFESSHQIFPYANLVILICVTFALPLITQAGFKRIDL